MRCCGRPGERRESTLPLQAEAAEAAEELGARVACLGGTPAPPPHVPLLTRRGAPHGLTVHPRAVRRRAAVRLAYWLRVRALDPGHDERSPAELHVVASNRALAEAFFRASPPVPRWSQRGRALRADRLRRAPTRRSCCGKTRTLPPRCGRCAQTLLVPAGSRRPQSSRWSGRRTSRASQSGCRPETGRPETR